MNEKRQQAAKILDAAIAKSREALHKGAQDVMDLFGDSYSPAPTREPALPSQATIDAVAEGLAAMSAVARDSLQIMSPGSTPYAYELLLKLLGIPADNALVAKALETHRDGPAELVSALRQLRDSKGEDDGDSEV